MMARNQVITTTADTPPGGKVKRVLGMVVGTSIRVRFAWTGSADEIVGSRKAALERMTAEAAAMGADAVIGARFDSVISDIDDIGLIEYTAYGTAVELHD